MHFHLRGKKDGAREGGNGLALRRADFEQEAALRGHHSRRIGEQAADEDEAVRAAV